MKKMPIKLFKKEDAVIRKISDSYQISNLLTITDSDKVSLGVSEANNHVETTKTSSDRAYYVLEGEIIVNDDFHAMPGDVIYISANTEYKFQGTFKAVIVNSPPFNKNKEA
jgi:ethanolamine utilization protein EutQ (cupin superfamily)